MEREQQARYRIGTVARLTGISTHTLRIWERRYRAVQPQRAAGGDRLYTEGDVARLRLLRKLAARGHAVRRIAALPTSDLETITDERDEANDGAARAVTRFVDAVAALDVTEAERVVARAMAGLEPQELADRVIAPIATEVGHRWAQGRIGVAHEHAATAILRNALGALVRMYVASGQARTAVVATPSGERHELGALMAAMSAAVYGWNVVYLGPDVPAPDIAAAVKRSGATLVLMSLVIGDWEPAGRQLRELCEALPAHVELVVGGAGAAALGESLRSGAIVGNLGDLRPLLT